jgi:PTH1 family peptidyl-tRNA hydrolase
MDKKFPFLIVGLGNPGKEYLNTRHNIGAHVVDSFAKQEKFPVKLNAKLDSFMSTSNINGWKIIYMIPTTYMNLSGGAVKKVLSYYHIPICNILILSDDTYIPFTEVRLKNKGSSGGHNGLKDIEDRLKSQEYMRLRIGIGEKQTQDLADFVLQRFTEEEESKIDGITQNCIDLIKNLLLENNNKNQVDKQKEDLRSN